MPSNPVRYKIADNVRDLHFPGSGILKIRLGEKDICLIKKDDELFACAARCPHAGGDLSAGYTDYRGNIVCPVHNFKFSFKNGRQSTGEDYRLKVYSAETSEEGVYVLI